MSELSEHKPPRRRRRFSDAFKARVVALCAEPGASVSRVALDHQLNANMVRRWISEARRAGDLRSPSPGFVPVSLPATADSIAQSRTRPGSIRIEIPRNNGTVVVEWPVEQAHQCAALLRELLA